MTCDEFLRLLDAYLDGELPVAETLRAHEHLASCDSCSRAVGCEAGLHARISEAVQAEEPPAGLRDRIRDRAAAGTMRFHRARSRWLRIAPGFVSALVAAGVLVWFTVDLTDHATPVAAELVRKHTLYSRDREGALEIVTSEPERMEPWLESRLGFPVRLPSLGRRSERLVGARISSLADAPAAYVRYDRNGRPISLFVTRRVTLSKHQWSERRVSGAEVYVASLRGVALAWWGDEGTDLVYAVASPADVEDVVDFATLCLGRGGRSTP